MVAEAPKMKSKLKRVVAAVRRWWQAGESGAPSQTPDSGGPLGQGPGTITTQLERERLQGPFR